MASVIGTNVVADENDLNKILEQYARLCEALYTRDNDHSRKAALQRQCVELIAGKGNNAARFKLVSGKYLKDLEKQLIDNNIPYFVMPNGAGDYMMVVPTEYEDKFIKAQENVFFTTTDHMASCKASQMIESAENMQYKDIIKLDFTDKAVKDLAVEKLYQKGIPSGTIDNKDGTFTVFIHPRCMYKEDDKDLVNFQLEMAYEASKGTALFGGENSEFLQERLTRAKESQNRVEDFINKLTDNQNFVLGDPLGTSSMYLEAKNGVLSLYTKNEKKQWEQKSFDIKGASKKDIANLCSVYTNKIHNISCIPGMEFEHSFKDKVRHKDDPEAKKYLPKEIENITEEYLKTARTGLNPMLDKITREASVATKEKFGTIRPSDSVTMKKAYEYKKAKIIELLSDKNYPPVMEFLYKNDNLTKEQKSQWIDEIVSIFKEEKEIPTMAMYVNEEKITKELKTVIQTTEQEMDLTSERSNEKQPGVDIPLPDME